jgi:hypothetical protein
MKKYSEYYVSYYSTEHKKKVLCYCCGLGDLSISEVELFERRSTIKDNPDFSLHKEIILPANSVAEMLEHHKALEAFALALHNCMAQWGTASAEIKTMLEYQGLAGEIRMERPKPQTEKESKRASKNDPPYETLDNAGKHSRIIEAVLEAIKYPDSDLKVFEDDYGLPRRTLSRKKFRVMLANRGTEVKESKKKFQYTDKDKKDRVDADSLPRGHRRDDRSKSETY